MSVGRCLTTAAKDFIGLDTTYTLATGKITRRHYLDSAATTLMMRSANATVQAFLPHYANVHSDLHFSGRVAHDVYQWAHDEVLTFLNATPTDYACVFVGNGATAALNRFARQLARLRPERPLVGVSEMEHHSNDLPHRKHATKVVHLPLATEEPTTGCLERLALENFIQRHEQQINYVALTASSNVTGLMNPIKMMAKQLHRINAYSIIDASQMVAHAPLDLSDGVLDCVVFSGHKIYAPGAPGVMVIKRSLLALCETDEVGGGMVDDVQLSDYQETDDLIGRAEAGTPNIPGAVLLASVLKQLRQYGMIDIHRRELDLWKRLVQALQVIPQVMVYGVEDIENTERTGILAFNIKDCDHGFVAAILNDYHNVAVRNDCFCAHPYVRHMLKPELWQLSFDPDTEVGKRAIDRRRGMVRASLGLYNTAADINALVHGIKDIIARQTEYVNQYRINDNNQYEHKTFHPRGKALYDVLFD